MSRYSLLYRVILVSGMVVSAVIIFYVIVLKGSLMQKFHCYPTRITVCYLIGTIGYIVAAAVAALPPGTTMGVWWIRKGALLTCIVAWPPGQILDSFHFAFYLRRVESAWFSPFKRIFYSISILNSAVAVIVLVIGFVDDKRTYCFWAGYLMSVFALLEYSIHGIIIRNNHLKRTHSEHAREDPADTEITVGCDMSQF